jgi:hypothetical protein
MAVSLPAMTVGDLQERAEFPLDGFEETYVNGRIREATDRIRSRWGSIVESRLASGAVSEDLFKDVVARAVLRIIRNPEGFTGETEGNYQYQKRATVASGYLLFTDEDIIDLVGVNTRTLPGTVRVGLYGG